jgi:hypothetical protein
MMEQMMDLDEPPNGLEPRTNERPVLYRLGIDAPPPRVRAPHRQHRVARNPVASKPPWSVLALGGAAAVAAVWTWSRQRPGVASRRNDSIEPRHVPGTARDIRVSMDSRLTPAE